MERPLFQTPLGLLSSGRLASTLKGLRKSVAARKRAWLLTCHEPCARRTALGLALGKLGVGFG